MVHEKRTITITARLFTQCPIAVLQLKCALRQAQGKLQGTVISITAVHYIKNNE